jgi:hypothetical protein
MSHPLLTFLLLSLFLTACASPPGPRVAPVPACTWAAGTGAPQVQAAGAGSPAGPALTISGPIVGAHTGQPVTADVYPLRGHRPRQPVARAAAGAWTVGAVFVPSERVPGWSELTVR